MMRLNHSVTLVFLSALSILALVVLRSHFNVAAQTNGSAPVRYYDVDKVLKMDNVVPVAVIGSGPAGLSASLWTSRAKYKTLVFAGPQPGGQLTEVQAIENWPGRPKSSGFEAIDDVREQAEHFGAQIIYDTVSKVNLAVRPFELETEKGARLSCLSLIIATGGTPKRLDVPGVKEYWGKKVGTCSICDAPFTKDQRVIIVGGGDSAGDRALQFAVYAKKVLMVVREPALEACGAVQEYLEQNKKIRYLFNTEIEEIIGDGTKVIGVKLKNNKTGEQKKIEIDGVYFAIGYRPNSELVKDFIETDEKGFIKRKDCTQKTSIEGVFVAGDVDDNPHRKAVVAMGSGVEASLNVMDFLTNQGFTPSVTRKLNYPSFVNHETIDVEGVKTIDELRTLLTEEKKPVLVDFYAAYCSTCRALIPELHMLAAEYEDTLKTVKVERSEAEDELFDHFGIKSVPYYIVFKNGQEITRASHIATPKELRDFVGKLMQQYQGDI